MISHSGLVVTIAFCTSVAAAQVQSIGDVSFAVPEGWMSSQRPSGNHTTVSFNRNGAIWTLAVFKSLPSTGNPDADFRAAWAQDVRSMPAPKRIHEHKGLAGYSGRYSSINMPDGKHYVYLCVLEAGQRVAPVQVITPNRRVFDDMEFLIVDVIESLRVTPAVAQPPKEIIRLADLVGEWRPGGDNSQTGAYAGLPARALVYSFRGDGSYTCSKADGSTQLGAGNVQVLGSEIRLVDKTADRVIGYHVISYQSTVNGSAALRLLRDTYEPSTANVNTHEERWLRRK